MKSSSMVETHPKAYLSHQSLKKITAYFRLSHVLQPDVVNV